MDEAEVKRLLKTAGGRARLRAHVAAELLDDANGASRVAALRCLSRMLTEADRHELELARFKALHD